MSAEKYNVEFGLVLRDAALMSPTLPGLYPCGEGAGYAGGIISAAVDGLRVADAILGNP